MRNFFILKNILYFLLVLFLFNSCKQKTEVTKIKPFELMVWNEDYSLGYTVQYIVTEKEMIIMSMDDTEPGFVDTLTNTMVMQNNVLLDTMLQANESLEKLSEINFDALKPKYKSACRVEDGLQISIKMTKDNNVKKIHISNYYQEDIGTAIELINSLVPAKLKIWYDKEALQKMNTCK